MLRRLTPAGAGNTNVLPWASWGEPAYPRRCGEHTLTTVLRSVLSGLPPQVRGTRSWPQPNPQGPGLTPAGAGNTVQTLRLGSTMPGLPPQVRGTQPSSGVDISELGLTPAGAGNTAVRSPSALSQRAYPRRCGEHHTWRHCCSGIGGLPPQVRGTRTRRLMGHDHRGLTPAGAGNTQPSSLRRMRLGGLPPQVRGTRYSAR